MLLLFQGGFHATQFPRALPWAMGCWPFRPFTYRRFLICETWIQLLYSNFWRYSYLRRIRIQSKLLADRVWLKNDLQGCMGELLRFRVCGLCKMWIKSTKKLLFMSKRRYGCQKRVRRSGLWWITWCASHKKKKKTVHGMNCKKPLRGKKGNRTIMIARNYYFAVVFVDLTWWL